MKHSFLDRYSDGHSLIHRLDPRTKFLATLLFIVAVSVTPPGRWLALAIYFGVIATLVLISRVPVSYVLKRSLVMVPFVLVVAVFLPFFNRGAVAGSYNIWLRPVSVSGWDIAENILARAWLCILSLILLSSTTRITSLLHGLEQLRLPRVMVMILSFMYRYIFVLVDEVMRMKQARDSRHFGGGALVADTDYRQHDRHPVPAQL